MFTAKDAYHLYLPPPGELDACMSATHSKEAHNTLSISENHRVLIV